MLIWLEVTQAMPGDLQHTYLILMVALKKVNLLSFSPAVTDGARIIVPTKLEVEPFSMTEYVTNLTQIYSDLTQAYLMVLLAARN